MTLGLLPRSDTCSLSCAMATLLHGFASNEPFEKMVVDSMRSVVKGLDTSRAALFGVQRCNDLIRLNTIYQLGFSEYELSKISCGDDLDDPGFARLWKAILNPGAKRYAAFSGGLSGPCDGGENAMLILVPIFDLIFENIVAVLFLQGSAERRAPFCRLEILWSENYGLVLGQVFSRQTYNRPVIQEESGLKNAARPPVEAPEMIGNSSFMHGLRRDLHEAYIPASNSRDPDPILIIGERGTGKDLIARYIYAHSSRSRHAFTAVNCAEITDELATSRFFGHKRGSFTGAIRDELGLFRSADHGILFLDEIGELSLRAQAILLRVLENRTTVALGETRENRVDVQVILATNRDLKKAVAEGILREDLCDRFRTHCIRIAPLRERPWDIPPLIHHFIRHHEKRLTKQTLGPDLDIVKMFVNYKWPGNVRELSRVCSMLIIHTQPNTRISSELIRAHAPEIANAGCNPMASSLLFEDYPMHEALKSFKRNFILDRLRKHEWNMRRTRESLHLPKTTFMRYMRECGIENAGMRLCEEYSGQRPGSEYEGRQRAG